MEAMWHHLYGGVVSARVAFGPAYRAAVAPLIAAAVDRLEKPAVHILVIGGGQAHFSRHLLPAVKESLRQVGNKVKIEVTESDAHPGSESGKNQIADMFELKKTFGNRRFDMVVGESVIHSGGPQEMGAILSSIHEILEPNGLLLHVQDVTPPVIWLSRSERTRAAAVEKEKPTLESKKEMAELSKRAHASLVQAIEQEAAKLGMTTETIGARSVRTVSKWPDDDLFAALKGKVNRLDYDHGNTHTSRVAGVPAGQYVTSYSGTVAVVSRNQINLKNHVKAKEFDHYGN